MRQSRPVVRRDFIKFLAASPYVASTVGVTALLRSNDSLAQQAPILLGKISADQPFASMVGHYVQLLGSSRPLTQVSETSGVRGVGNITGPQGSSRLRFGKITDPLNAGRKVFYLAAKQSDGMTFTHLGRVEMGIDQLLGAIQKKDVTYWISTEMFIGSNRFSGGNGTLMNIHNSTPNASLFGPFSIAVLHSVFPNRGVAVVHAWSSQPDPTMPGFNEQIMYPWTSDNPGFPGNPITDNVTQTFGAYPVGQWVKYVCKYRGDPDGTTGLLQIWLTVNGTTTQIVNLTNIRIGTAPLGFPNDYVKSGLDDYELGGGVSGTWELRRSLSLYRDNGNTEPQIRALMP
jgi:hypothetical protein